MLRVKSCNVKLNSENVFRYFASAVTGSNSSTKSNRKDLYAISCVVIEAFKKSVCSSVRLSQIVVWYTATGLCITLHSSPARRDSPCADSPDRDSGLGIHLITAV